MQVFLCIFIVVDLAWSQQDCLDYGKDNQSQIAIANQVEAKNDVLLTLALCILTALNADEVGTDEEGHVEERVPTRQPVAGERVQQLHSLLTLDYNGYFFANDISDDNLILMEK